MDTPNDSGNNPPTHSANKSQLVFLLAIIGMLFIGVLAFLLFQFYSVRSTLINSPYIPSEQPSPTKSFEDKIYTTYSIDITPKEIVTFEYSSDWEIVNEVPKVSDIENFVSAPELILKHRQYSDNYIIIDNKKLGNWNQQKHGLSDNEAVEFQTNYSLNVEGGTIGIALYKYYFDTNFTDKYDGAKWNGYYRYETTHPYLSTVAMIYKNDIDDKSIQDFEKLLKSAKLIKENKYLNEETKGMITIKELDVQMGGLSHYDLFVNDELIESYRPDGGGHNGFRIELGRVEQMGEYTIPYVVEIDTYAEFNIYYGVTVKRYNTLESKLEIIDEFEIHDSLEDIYKPSDDLSESEKWAALVEMEDECIELVDYREGLIEAKETCPDQTITENINQRSLDFKASLNKYLD